MEIIYDVLEKIDDFDFYVGYFYKPDTFKPIKGFKHWEEAQEYYLKLFFETLEENLRILDVIHKRYTYLKFEQEDVE